MTVANWVSAEFERAVGEIARRPLYLLLNFAIGVAVLFVNFPKVVTRTIDVNVESESWRRALKAPVEWVQVIVAGLIGHSPGSFFQRVMTLNFLLLFSAVVLLVVFAIRRRDPRMLPYASAGFVGGYVALHLIAWAAAIIVMLVGGALFIVHWIFAIVSAIFAFLAPLVLPALLLAALAAGVYYFAALRSLLLRVLAWLKEYAVAIVVGSVVLALLIVVLPIFYRWVLVPIGRFLLWLLSPIIAVFVYIRDFLAWLLSPVIAFFVYVRDFLAWLLAPVVHAILFLLLWLLIIVVSLIVLFFLALVIALAGTLQVKLLTSAWFAAHNRSELVAAGFAVGAALSFITLVSVATPDLADALNRGFDGAAAILGLGPHAGAPSHTVTDAFFFALPSELEEFVLRNLTNLEAPASDSLVLLAALGFVNMSVALRAFSATPTHDEQVDAAFVAREYAFLVVGLLVVVTFAFLSAGGGHSDS